MTSNRPPDEVDRGQTLPDFALGVALFLVAITFVFLFVPQLSLPYDNQEQPVVSERVANDITHSMLAEGGTPSELNETETSNFFSIDGSDVPEEVGITSTYSVNVTLRDTPSDDPGSTVCGDSFEDCQSGSNDLAVGPPTPDDEEAVSIARKRVFVGDTSGVIEVGVW